MHGDFHHQNLLIRDGRITGVIDWDGAGRGDRRPTSPTGLTWPRPGSDHVTFNQLALFCWPCFAGPVLLALFS